MSLYIWNQKYETTFSACWHNRNELFQCSWNTNKYFDEFWTVLLMTNHALLFQSMWGLSRYCCAYKAKTNGRTSSSALSLIVFSANHRWHIFGEQFLNFIPNAIFDWITFFSWWKFQFQFYTNDRNVEKSVKMTDLVTSDIVHRISKCRLFIDVIRSICVFLSICLNHHIIEGRVNERHSM